MRTIEQRIAGVIAEHTWWLAGNLGVPRMSDWTTYKCNCGWNGDEPHAHVAAAVVAELGLRLSIGGQYIAYDVTLTDEERDKAGFTHHRKGQP